MFHHRVRSVTLSNCTNELHPRIISLCFELWLTILHEHYVSSKGKRFNTVYNCNYNSYRHDIPINWSLDNYFFSRISRAYGTETHIDWRWWSTPQEHYSQILYIMPLTIFCMLGFQLGYTTRSSHGIFFYFLKILYLLGTAKLFSWCATILF